MGDRRSGRQVRFDFHALTKWNDIESFVVRSCWISLGRTHSGQYQASQTAAADGLSSIESPKTC
jgi:hypothetical protein